MLFLDEMTEMDRSVIEALRQPLESGDIKISRVGYSETLPADFILIGAANPCRCGYLLEGDGRCSCTPRQIGQTMAKLSKPLMDRIDLHVPVRSLRPAQMESAEDGRAERSETVRARVCAAWEMQQTRYRDVQTTAPLNARVPRDALERHCSLSASCRTLLRSAAERLGFSMRAYEKILRIARTVADMNGHGALREEDIAEAIQYRQLDLHADAELTVRRRA